MNRNLVVGLTQQSCGNDRTLNIEKSIAGIRQAATQGAQLAVLSGDPMGSGPFAVRLKLPDGYKIAPHWHPTEEAITVIEGTFLLGMGDQWSDDSLKTLPVGSFGKMPQKMNHYAQAKGDTIVQVEGMGPFQLTYVNPSDDPRKK